MCWTVGLGGPGVKVLCALGDVIKTESWEASGGQELIRTCVVCCSRWRGL